MGRVALATKYELFKAVCESLYTRSLQVQNDIGILGFLVVLVAADVADPHHSRQWWGVVVSLLYPAWGWEIGWTKAKALHTHQ